MTWMQHLAKELETSTDRAFAWLLAAVMKPWRDRSLAYDLFGNPFALKEYRAMVRMAEEMLRGLIRELARKIVVVEEEEPAPAPKKRFAIGKTPPLRPVRGDFYFRMRDRFAYASPPAGVRLFSRVGGPRNVATSVLPREGDLASSAAKKTEGAAFVGRGSAPSGSLRSPPPPPGGGPNSAAKSALSCEGELAAKQPEGAAFPVEKREEPDLTLIGLQLLLRAQAVDTALRQAKRHAMRYAYAQARKAQRLALPAPSDRRQPRAQAAHVFPPRAHIMQPAKRSDSS